MKKLICAILCAAMLAALCACGEAPAKPDPVAAVKSAIEIMHYDNYGDIYSALKKARERTPGYGDAAKFTMADTAVENAAVGTAGAAADSAAAPAQNQTVDFSKTNVQVEGIDEGDIVKTDGKYIYALKDTELLVYKPDGAETKLVSRLALNTKDGQYPAEMYVSGDRLAVVFQSYMLCYAAADTSAASTAAADIAYPASGSTSIALYDITAPEAPKAITTLGQDGSLLSSRLMDGKLYLVTNFYAYSAQPVEGDPKTYTPCTYENSASTAIPAQNIAVLPDASDSGYAVVCAYDIKSAALSGTLSVLGSGSTFYMSANKLYVASAEYSDVASPARTDGVYTVVDHKCTNTSTITAIDLGTLTAKACGKVPGNLMGSYAMDEYNGYLRAATTDNSCNYSIYTDKAKGFENYQYGKDNATVNALNVLDSGMNIVGRAENIARGETIYSVRFDGEAAYLCTFRQTDPLFAYDLSNPASPVKLGEMKITGFSDYLHVWGDGRLFGLGQSATEQGSVTGMKMVMFDISDKANVGVKASLDLGDNYSEALNDPNAILISPDKNIIGFALDSGYVLYSYADDGGFKKLAEVKGSGWDYNMRGLYIGSYLYIVAQGGVTVIDMGSYGVVKTVNV